MQKAIMGVWALLIVAATLLVSLPIAAGAPGPGGL